MSENLGMYAYQTDPGEASTSEHEAEHQAEQSPAFPAAPGYHADGSRTWRFVESADPRKWSDLAWIDQNVDEVKSLGWIVDNPQGQFWTVEEATHAYDTYIAAATEPYRYVDDEAAEYPAPEAAVAATPAAQPAHPTAPEAALDAAAAAAVPDAPAAPAAPAGPQWERPADPTPGGTTHADVMSELRERVPENDGRWSATQAAAVYGDQQFFDEQGITAAQDRAMAASTAATAADGTVTTASYHEVVDTAADVDRAVATADSTRNRYQQSTDFAPAESEQDRQARIDEGTRAAHDLADQDPAALGLNMTYEQQQARADVQEYMARTGQTLDPATPLNDEQRAWLEQARSGDQDRAQQDYAAWQASPDGQAAQAAADQEQARYAAQQERVDASRQAAEERMQTPTSERLN